MRFLLTTVTLLVAMLAGPSAFAQQPVYHPICLQRGSSIECAYSTMTECQEAKVEPSDTCMQNQAPGNR